MNKDLKQRDWGKVGIALVVFAVAIFSQDLIFSISAYKDFYFTLPKWVQWLEDSVRTYLIVAIGLFAVFRCGPGKMLEMVGLKGRSFMQGLIFAFLCVVPFLIALPFMPIDTQNIDPMFMVYTSLIWPLREEVLFRGYAFRQVFQYSGYGFWPAALLSSVVFALVHLGQASFTGLALNEAIGGMAMLVVFALIGAWIYVRMNCNLWAIFFFHGFVNFAWDISIGADNFMGDVVANVLRASTLIIGIVLALYWNKIPFLKRFS